MTQSLPYTIPLDTFELVARFCDPTTLKQLRLCNKEVNRQCTSNAVNLSAFRLDRNNSCRYWRDPYLLHSKIRESAQMPLFVLQDVFSSRDRNPELDVILKVILECIEANQRHTVLCLLVKHERLFLEVLRLCPDYVIHLECAPLDRFLEVIAELIPLGGGHGCGGVKGLFNLMGVESVKLGSYAYQVFLYACCVQNTDVIKYITTLRRFDELMHTKQFENLCSVARNYINTDSIVCLKAFCRHVQATDFYSEMRAHLAEIIWGVSKSALKNGPLHFKIIRNAHEQLGLPQSYLPY